MDIAEFERLKSEVSRYKQQVEGSKAFYDKARSTGFTKIEDFDRWAPAIQTLTKQGADPQRLAQAFSATIEENTDDPKAQIKDIEALLDQKLTAREKEWVTKQAQKEHDSLLKSDFDELSEDKINSEFKDEPESLRKLMAHAAFGMYQRGRKPYEGEHPLAEQGWLAPGGKESIASIRQQLKELATAARAGQLTKIGDAARRQTPSTPAGNAGGGGKPEDSDNKRPGGLPSREAVEAALAARAARRS